MPPIPIAAMFILSDGEMCPKLLPNIELGAMVKPATAAAPDFKKVRLEMFAIIIVVLLLLIIGVCFLYCCCDKPV